MRKFFSLLLLSIVFLNSCSTREGNPTAEEATRFALSLEKAVAEKQMNVFEKNIFVAALVERIYKSKETKKIKSSKSALEKAVASGLKKHNYEKSLFQTLGSNGHFSIVKHYDKEEKRRVIFRAYGAGGLNYYDMELTKIKGQVGIADILLYTTGNNLSASMAELAEKILDTKEGKVKNLESAMLRIQTHVRSGDYEKAKVVYDDLPEEIKNTKLMEAVFLGIVPNLSGNEYDTALAKLEKKYYNDPNSQLMLIDLYLVKMDYDKALRSIDMIDKNINSDPFLNFYRGLVFNMKKDTEKALEHFEKTAIALPTFADNIAELFVQYAADGNVEMAKKYFNAYKALKNKDPEVINYYEEEYPFLAE